MSPRHTSAVTCLFVFFLSGQQVKVKLTHRQLQAGGRLKGLSTAIIAISKKKAGLPLPLERASWHLQLSLPENADAWCQLFYSSKKVQEKNKKGGSSASQSFRKDL